MYALSDPRHHLTEREQSKKIRFRLSLEGNEVAAMLKISILCVCVCVCVLNRVTIGFKKSVSNETQLHKSIK